MFDYGFLSQKFIVKTPCSILYFVGNEGLYSVGKGMRKDTQNNQVESFAGYSRLGLNCEWLAKSSLPITFQIQSCASHVACFMGWHSRASGLLVAKSSSSQNLHQTLHMYTTLTLYLTKQQENDWTELQSNLTWN